MCVSALISWCETWPYFSCYHRILTANNDRLFPTVQVLPLDTEAIMCNNTKMLRQRLNISGDGLREQNWDQDSEYVYDLYYQEMATPGWIQDILSVRAYADEGELVCGCRNEGGFVFKCSSWSNWDVAVVYNRCRTSWSTKRRCTMMRMMKMMKQTGGTTTLMRAIQRVTKRNAMVVCIYVVDFGLPSSHLHNSSGVLIYRPDQMSVF